MILRIVQSLFLFVVVLFVPLFTNAQEAYQELKEVVKAEVVSIESVVEREVTGTGTTVEVQTLRARINSGVREGVVVEFDNDLVTLKEGDRIFLNRLVTINDSEYYVFKDVDRRMYLVILAALFAVLLLAFAGMQGLRALLSLIASVGAIIFVLVPALLAGYNPALASLVIAGAILAFALFGTHGFNARSTIAFLGTFAAVVVTCGIAALFVHLTRLTGFGSDASIYLNFSTGGALDFAGLLLGSIIIGILGVLDDVSITQASVVQELKHANSALGFRELYGRAIRVGRDHVGSLVNTLALAYVGVSLPLVLLYANAGSDAFLSLNQEVIAAELVRIFVGSIGLILAVPFTTLAAAWWFGSHEVSEKEISSTGHHHHSH